MKVFYYYYYLFYTKILPDKQPHLTVVFTLSLSISFLVTSLADLIIAHLYNYSLSANIMIGIFALLFLINYLIYIRGGKGQLIVTIKPMFFNNHILSISLTVMFFITTLSLSLLMPVFIGNLLGTR